MPEPIMACGCTRKLLVWIILWSLWAWVAVHRKITRYLGISQKYMQSLDTPGASIHLDVYLSCHLKLNHWLTISQLSWIHSTQSTCTSIAWQYKQRRSNSQRFDNKTGDRFYLIIYFPIPTCYQSYSCNVWGLKLMHKNWVMKSMIKVLLALLMIRET